MISVSIAEDLSEVRVSLEKLIQEQPDMLLLSSFPNAEEAMPRLKEQQPDIVIMDINMPLLNGLKTVSKSRLFFIVGP